MLFLINIGIVEALNVFFSSGKSCEFQKKRFHCITVMVRFKYLIEIAGGHRACGWSVYL